MCFSNSSDLKNVYFNFFFSWRGLGGLIGNLVPAIPSLKQRFQLNLRGFTEVRVAKRGGLLSFTLLVVGMYNE